ncbi:rhomboid family intramembrane serine protease [Leucobacter sp. GX24907]
MANGSRPEFGERADYGAEDVCYRHPRTHSFTLCQRCGRTICTDCQIQSAVGVLCPDCVRETQPSTAKRASRSAKVAARRLGDHDKPVVTYAIMGLCAVVFVLQLISRHFGGDEVTRLLWYVPFYSLPDGTYSNVGFEPWRMVTVMFTHSTGFLFHILFNLYALFLFGPNLERMLGRLQYALLYLFSGVGGAVGVMLWVYADPMTENVPTVGASGAIFGVLAATLVAFRAARINATSLAVLLAINFGIGFLPGAAISWQAHLGGMIFGAITMWVLLSTRGPRKRVLRGVGMLIVAAALIGLSFAYFVVMPAVQATM